MKSSGGPKRLVGAKYPVTWYPQEPKNGCSITGRNSTWVNPMSFTYDTKSWASSAKLSERLLSCKIFFQEPICTSYTEYGFDVPAGTSLRLLNHFLSCHL